MLLELSLLALAPQVWFFLQEDCPISKYYAPEIARICQAHPEVRCTIVLMNPPGHRIANNPGLDGIEVHVDHDHSWARRAGATVTPEAVVFDAQGGVAYRGRIDNYFYGWGKRRGITTAHNLRDALAALSAGRTYPPPWPPAIGCYIETIGEKK